LLNQTKMWVPISKKNPIDPYEYVTEAHEYLENVKQVQKLHQQRIDERKNESKKEYKEWLMNKDRIYQCKKLLKFLSPQRAMNVFLRNKVGNALYAISSTDLMDAWLDWCKPAIEFKRVRGWITVTKHSTNVLTSKNILSEVFPGDAVMINKVVYAVDIDGEFTDRSFVLSSPYTGASATKVSMYRCSDYTLDSLKADWYSFHW